MILHVNAIYVPVEECADEVPFEGPHRIIGIDRHNGIIALFGINLPLKAPFSLDHELMGHLIAQRKIQHGTLATPGYMLRTSMSEKERAIFESRKVLLEPFLKNNDDAWIFDAALRGDLVTHQMTKHQKPRITILRWLYHYLRYGMFQASLYCAYSHKGGQGKTRACGEKKRGRPRYAVVCGHDPTRTGVNITDEIRAIFRVYIDLHYTKNGEDLTFAYQQMINGCFSDVEISEGGKKKYLEHLNVPTIEQFRYWHKEDGDLLKELRLRQGSKRFNLRCRGLGGRSGENCTGPTDKYEIDSTVLDLYCVNSYNPAWIIGRPILYFVVDTASRMIVGFHLALTGPCWNEARIAIYNAFTDKVAFCARNGIEISAEDWPCSHLPQTILVDRGELRAHKPRGIIEGLGIEIDLAPPFRGDFKSTVERRFRLLNDRVVRWLPGAVRARERERGDRDYRLDAVLTMRDVEKIITYCVLEHNNHREFPDLLTREMIRGGIEPTPVAMWNWGLKNALGSPRQEDPRNVFCHLLREGKASVQADGIWFKGLRYTCETENNENWRAFARNRGRGKVPVRWLPESVNHIWIMNERDGSFEECEILAPEERYRDCRVDECIDAEKYLKLEAEDRKPSRMGAAIETDVYFQNLVAEAMQKKPSTKAKTKKEQIGDISANRLMERILSLNPNIAKSPEMLQLISKPNAPINEEDQNFRDEVAKLLAALPEKQRE
ncbi:hypothetical protein [Geobacter anodireducens]